MKLYRECDTCDGLGANTQGTGCVVCGDMGTVEVEAQVVPWCAEHDSRMVEPLCCVYSAATWGGGLRCRLEEPARHYLIEP